MSLINDRELEFQLNCPETNTNFCKTCSFFAGCQRKYNLTNNDKELCLILKEAIVLFSNIDAYHEFKETFNCSENLEEFTEDQITNLLGDNLDLIIYN